MCNIHPSSVFQIGDISTSSNVDLPDSLPRDGDVPWQISGGDVASGLSMEAAGRTRVE